ncbi:MAG TPA: DNA-binding domain-containing protein [Lysobacter sp.]|jgi:hypothetical protein|nr:DNA-binding domain-containing protein [Lysobacter sp.]
MNASDQSIFAAALLDSTLPTPPGLTAWNGSDPGRRFAVYRNNVAASLVEALASTFPVTRALVGDAFFDAMAREFIAASPPRSRLLAEYGDGLPGFISEFTPASELPWLADVACIEVLRVRAYHAADACALTAEAFRSLLQQPDLLAETGVLLHPACFWLRTAHATFSLWAAHQHVDDDVPDLGAIDIDVPQDVLITRPMLEVHTLCLPVGGADFLDALAAGRPLGEAVAHATATHPDFDATSSFTLLIREGLVVRLQPAASFANYANTSIPSTTEAMP